MGRFQDHGWAKFSELTSADIQKLGVVWSYYSGKTEGNVYTYPETETLLIDGVTSIRKSSDAQILINLHTTFSSVISSIRSKMCLELSETTIKQMHQDLISGLIDNNERGDFRRKPVAITGTDYVPPKEENQIKEEFARILKEQKEYSNPLEKAVFLHCNLARIKPFINGNKRTARMTESLVLMQNNLVPVYSTKDEDFVRYRDALLKFYETKDYSKYADYFLNF